MHSPVIWMYCWLEVRIKPLCGGFKRVMFPALKVFFIFFNSPLCALGLFLLSLLKQGLNPGVPRGG